MVAQGTRRVETGLRDLDALIAYLQKRPELGGTGVAASPSRIRRVR
jgi:5'-nucleotidase